MHIREIGDRGYARGLLYRMLSFLLNGYDAQMTFDTPTWCSVHNNNIKWKLFFLKILFFQWTDGVKKKKIAANILYCAVCQQIP